MTIHKAQGQAVDFLKVDLSRVWLPGSLILLSFKLFFFFNCITGQAYTAVSRCRSAAGLQVVGFIPDAVCSTPNPFLPRLTTYPETVLRRSQGC
jgi:ATP-dependent exoDNAse (exonuclease V) alpha subunit